MFDSEDNVIFEFSLFNKFEIQSYDKEPDETQNCEEYSISAIFNEGNRDKRFTMTLTRLENPNGVRVKGVGDMPPNSPGQALIGYLVREAEKWGFNPIYAMGELMHWCCLDYIDRYYIKLPYMPDSEKSTRFMIQPCGRVDNKHYHIFEIDDVTKAPVDVERDLDDDGIPNMGAVFITLFNEHFSKMDEMAAAASGDIASRIQEIARDLMKAAGTDVDAKDVDITAISKEQADIILRTQAEMERHEPPKDDEKDFFNRIWNAGPTTDDYE